MTDDDKIAAFERWYAQANLVDVHDYCRDGWIAARFTPPPDDDEQPSAEAMQREWAEAAIRVSAIYNAQQKAIREALEDAARLLQVEIDHAAINGHALDLRSQGCATGFTGKPEPAIRASAIKAVRDRLRGGA
jgi:hypothetical protein